MQIQRFFIYTIFSIFFINFLFINNLSAISFGGFEQNISETENKTWLNSVFDCVLSFGDCAYKGTQKVTNLYQKIGEIYFGIEPVKIDDVKIDNTDFHVEDIDINGEKIGVEDLSDLTNPDMNRNDDLSDIIGKGKESGEDIVKKAEQGTKDKIASLEKEIKDAEKAKAETKSSAEKAELQKEIDNNKKQLVAEQKKIQDLKDEREALTSNEKSTAEFNNQVRQAQAGQLPRYSDSVLNQSGLQGTPDFYDGKFVCNENNNGTFAGNERPRNQGGKVSNELFYAIANAAKASGANVGSFGCFNSRNIAGTNTPSKHSTGDACDVVLKGNDAKYTAFLVMFMANTGNHNTVGSYRNRNFDHSHLGADCGGTWCPYQKGAGLEPWKELAFRTVYQACGKNFNPSDRPSKKWIQDCAKKAVETFCNKSGDKKDNPLTS
jgi:hypothetical protein